VRNVYQQRTISKVPGMIDYSCSATSGNSVCIGSYGGQVLIMTFPKALLSGSETRPDPAEVNSTL
jgi:hypothetical protein